MNRTRVVLGLAGPVTMVLFGAFRLGVVERRMANAPKVTVGIVQANVSHEISPDDALALHLDATRRLEAAHKLDLVVWPETAIRGVIPSDAIDPTLRSITSFPTGAMRIEAPLLTGAVVDHHPAVTNSAILYADNRVRGTYDKKNPLMFGEYIPFVDVFPSLQRFLPHTNSITAGTHDEPLRLGEHRISALICYEDILAGPANRAVAHANPDLLVNLTNDAWFGDSNAAVAHLALAKFRAVEHRRYLVHATNSGVSAFVDPTGKATSLTPMLDEATAVETLRWMRARTVYEDVGDAPLWIAALVAALMALVTRPTRPSQPT